MIFLAAVLFAISFFVLDIRIELHEALFFGTRKTSFFRDTYRCVGPEEIRFPRSRSMVVILSESLEESFADGRMFCGRNCLPHLTEWREKHACFRNQKQVTGTDITVEAQFAMQYGLPRLMPCTMVLSRNRFHYPDTIAPCIWDAWLAHGFRCTYIQGCDLAFANTRALFPEHPKMKLIGRSELEADPQYLAEKRPPLFGVNDEVMFRHLKEEILESSASGEPFVVWAMTLNVHRPSDFRSVFEHSLSDDDFENVVLHQDELTAEFLEWFASQPFAGDIAILVLGDHRAHGDFSAVPDHERRGIWNAVSLPGVGTLPSHGAFATFDYAPTLLEITGAELPEHRFGMGVSLLSDHLTVLERYRFGDFDHLINGSREDFANTVFTEDGRW